MGQCGDTLLSWFEVLRGIGWVSLGWEDIGVAAGIVTLQKGNAIHIFKGNLEEKF